MGGSDFILNHRLGEVGRDLIWSNLLLKQGLLELVTQEYVQTAFGYLHGWRLCNLSGQPMAALTHANGKQKKSVYRLFYYQAHRLVNVYEGCQYKGFFQLFLQEN